MNHPLLILTDDLNLTAIGDQLKKIANMEADIKYTQIKVGVDTKAVLTQEQKANLKMILEHERATGMSTGKMDTKEMQPQKSSEPAPKPIPEMHHQ